MADRRSSEGIIRGCGGAFGMTPVAITPKAQIVYRGKETHALGQPTRRLIAGAGLTAEAIFVSLPFHGSSHPQGLPTQQQDVALVDATYAKLLSDEGGTSQAANLADYNRLPVTSLLGGAL